MTTKSLCIKLYPSAFILLAGLYVALAMPGGATPASAATPATTQPAAQQSFASADAAVAALVKSIQTHDSPGLLAILGPGGEKLVASGDPVADAAGRKNFLTAYAAYHNLAPMPDGSMVLSIGDNDWPMPIPLVHVGNGWQFDATNGAEDIIDRRIGRNELKTIQTLLAIAAAEEDYASRLKSGTGTGAFAQRMISLPGTEDGLYWDASDGEAESPLGPLIDQAEDEGYPGAPTPDGKQYPYHGYLFHILKAQGPYAPSGAKAYIKDGKMTEGFAFVAWPAIYENSGVMTFLINQDGIVFQKDLGPDTDSIARTMTEFNPDLSWARIDISN